MQSQGHVHHFWFCVVCPYVKDLNFNEMFQCIMKPYTIQSERKQWFISIFYTFSILALCASCKFNFGNLSPAMQLHQVFTAKVFKCIT